MENIEWKLKGFYKVDAQKAYEEIQSLEEITDKNVVDLARNEKSCIHNEFEWNDTIAGEKWRERQAQLMIQSFVIKVEEKEEHPMRVFQISTKKHVYQPIQFFIEHKDEYQALLERAIRELQGIKHRYKTIVELEEVFNAIDAL